MKRSHLVNLVKASWSGWNLESRQNFAVNVSVFTEYKQALFGNTENMAMKSEEHKS